MPINWVAFKIDDSTFCIYDTLEGEIASAFRQ